MVLQSPCSIRSGLINSDTMLWIFSTSNLWRDLVKSWHVYDGRNQRISLVYLYREEGRVALGCFLWTLDHVMTFILSLSQIFLLL